MQPFIIMTDYAEVNTAVESMKLGSIDYIPKLYRLLHGDVLPDGEALSHAVTAVLDKGAEIIRLAEEERRKYEDG